MKYQVLARRFRPQKFQDVVGQEAIVTTLIHAIQGERVAQAYLFCGYHGTGKTTLARLFAKALNCNDLSKECEPCNRCPSCKEITSGNALDVLEIDGASHRGIEDIRQINEAVHFTPVNGKYKIYLIDEVHMLTKEAFNALLKTLEEPPEHVKFFFATTEPHKLPATILSRCQRLNLKRISMEKIQSKLEEISQDLKATIESEALELISQLSDGSLRDAESLLDQVMAFQHDQLTVESVREVLGLPAAEIFNRLDHSRGNSSVAFDIAEEIFSSGKNIAYFLEELIRHYRTLLLAKRSVGSHPNSACYRDDQLLTILELLCEGVQTIKSAPSERVHLEMLLLQIIRSHERVPLEHLVKRLIELENGQLPQKSQAESTKAPVESKSPKTTLPKAPAKPKAPSEPKTTKAKQASQSTKPPSSKEQSQIDTLMRFAAKELKGSLKQG